MERMLSMFYSSRCYLSLYIYVYPFVSTNSISSLMVQWPPQLSLPFLPYFTPVQGTQVYSHTGQLAHIHRHKKTVHVNYVAKASWKQKE